MVYFSAFSGKVSDLLLASRLLPWAVQLELHWWVEHWQVSMMRIATEIYVNLEVCSWRTSMYQQFHVNGTKQKNSNNAGWHSGRNLNMEKQFSNNFVFKWSLDILLNHASEILGCIYRNSKMFWMNFSRFRHLKFWTETSLRLRHIPFGVTCFHVIVDIFQIKIQAEIENSTPWAFCPFFNIWCFFSFRWYSKAALLGTSIRPELLWWLCLLGGKIEPPFIFIMLEDVQHTPVLLSWGLQFAHMSQLSKMLLSLRLWIYQDDLQDLFWIC